MERPIYTASIECHGNLLRCVDRYEPFRDDWANQRLIDFNLWSAASGASEDGRYSLDDKLLMAKPTATVVSDLLDLLSIFVNACNPSHDAPTSPALSESGFHEAETGGARISPKSGASAVSTSGAASDEGQRRGWPLFLTERKKSTRPLSSEEREARAAAEDTFNSVVNVTAAARRSILHSGLWIADLSFTEDDMDIQEYQYKLLRQMRSPLKLGSVKSRLMRANLIRRHRFLQAREGRPEGGHKFPERISCVRPELEEPKWPRRSKVVYPDPPQIPDDCRAFECPYCFRILPAFLADPDPWKEHMAADLCPFTCISPSCTKASQLYSSKSDWKNHILSSHGTKVWTCQECNSTFDQEDAFSYHLSTEHASTVEIPEDCMAWILASHGQRKPNFDLSCPVCALKPSEGSNLDHIATCLQDLAWSAFVPPASKAKTTTVSLGLPTPVQSPIKRLGKRRLTIRTGGTPGSSVSRPMKQKQGIPKIVEPSTIHRSGVSKPNYKGSRTRSPSLTSPSFAMMRSISDMILGGRSDEADRQSVKSDKSFGSLQGSGAKLEVGGIVTRSPSLASPSSVRMHRSVSDVVLSGRTNESDWGSIELPPFPQGGLSVSQPEGGALRTRSSSPSEREPVTRWKSDTGSLETRHEFPGRRDIDWVEIQSNLNDEMERYRVFCTSPTGRERQLASRA